VADQKETGEPGRVPSPDELRKVFALAARPLSAEDRSEVDPQLALAAERQRRIAMALQSGGPATPPGLHARLDSMSRQRGGRGRSVETKRRWAPSLRLGMGLAVACVLAIAIVTLLVPSGSGRLSAARVAAAWKQPATSSAVIANPGDPAVLDVGFHGSAFPNYHDSEGWHPVGARSGRIGGRPEYTVYYAVGSRRAAYTVVAGAPVSVPSSARHLVVGGLHMTEFRDGDRWIIVFRDRGNTCVLTAAAPREKKWLVKLAVWDAARAVPRA
jgi:hypothetical protein